MGVTGLWRLIEPAGKPVPVETLENKVLAVDISIWLHQMVKGYQDAKGAPLPNAHLIGLFQRVCKLLYFRVRPVFVFDGAFPELKKETINKRKDNKLKYNSESERIKRELALLLSKKTAINSLLGKQISPKKSSTAVQNDDIFKLPALPQREDSESESEDEEQNSSGSVIDLHSVDMESEKFKNLPVKEKYDLLIELKDTRKMNSWGKLHELPKKSDNFSDFQMQRLLKRRKVQECFKETEKEIGDCGMSLNDLESFLNDEGIDTKIEALPTRRIAANDTTRFVLINDVKKALAEAKKKEGEAKASTSKIQEIDDSNIASDKENSKRDVLEKDIEKAIKMSLECENDANTSACTSKTDDSWTTFDTDYSSDSEEEDGCEAPDMSSAKAYIMQYSDFTNKAIDDIVSIRNKGKNKIKKPKLNEIMEEIRKEKLVVLDNVDLSSDDDDDYVPDSEGSETKDSTPTNAVVELNTSADFDSQNEKNVVATQASLECLGTPAEDIVSLDSSSEESLSQSKNLSSPQLTNGENSDSSDSDFEDVPEVEESKKKTIVQLTLNVNDAPEDDIFADVFVANKDPDVKIQNYNPAIITPQLDSIELDEDDEELQRAIKMSLEADIEEPQDSDEVELTNNIYTPMPETKDPTPDILKETNNKLSAEVNPKISKTQESLDFIQTLAPPTKTTKDIPTHKETDKPTEKANPTEKSTQPLPPISKEILNGMVEEIQNEEQDLIQEKGRLDRVGRNITEQMTKEAQELLRLFGIPYIVAPMEAEAQCAFLESIKLTDGTITDDSDIWLFGGKTVYKNFFNQKKHVLQFLSDRIERSFNLNREQLILLALLVGSDYTTGLTGVGPVTALEILASFPFNKRKLLNEMSKQIPYAEIIAGLNEFKQWVRSGKRTDNTSLKKKLRNVTVTDDFPSIRVVQAYLEPNIEKSQEKFTWGEIDITILRDYTKAKFGWSQHKLDEIMKPVLKRMVECQTQKTLHDYFKRKGNLDSMDQLSKRVKAAVQKMGPEQIIEEITNSEDILVKPGTKRKVKNKSDGVKAGPSKSKQNRTDAEVLKSNIVKVVTDTKESNESNVEIVIPKTDRYQEIIPQREKDKQSLLQNKMKAIELFRKTQIDKKKKGAKKKPILPKPEAELSESSDSN